MRAIDFRLIKRYMVSVSLVLLAAGCVSSNVTLVPGADQIKVTKVPTDVTSCVAVGNVDGSNASGLTINGIRQMQNQTVVVGGNTVLVTSEISPQKGVAYRCGPPGN